MTRRFRLPGLMADINVAPVAAKRTGKGPGRPPVPARHRRSDRITIRLRPGELAALERAADKQGVTIGELARRRIAVEMDERKEE